MPGPGYYGDAWATYQTRQRTMTQYVGPVKPAPASAHDLPLPGPVGRIPRGHTFGAPKTGPLTGVEQHMVGMGKGNATRGAGQYSGAGVEVGKAPVLSTVASAPSASFGRRPRQLPAAHGHVDWAREGGGALWGQFSRLQGDGHLPYTTPTHPPPPGPDAYQGGNMLKTAPVPSHVFDKGTRFSGKDVGAVDAPGPGAYRNPEEVGPYDRGFSFGFSTRDVGGVFDAGLEDLPGPGYYDPYHYRQAFPDKGSSLGTFALADRVDGTLIQPLAMSKGPLHAHTHTAHTDLRTSENHPLEVAARTQDVDLPVDGVEEAGSDRGNTGGRGDGGGGGGGGVGDFAAARGNGRSRTYNVPRVKVHSP